MTQDILQFDGISKDFFGVPALQDVAFTLGRGRLLGLVGANGAGKTTLMNILGGVTPPDRGVMKLRGASYAPRSPADATRAGVAFIHQELNLFTNLSITDNIFIDRFPRLVGTPFINIPAARRQAQRLLESLSLKVSPETLVDRLAPGERQLVEVAKALSSGAEIILFDEPTTSLTAGEIERLFGIIDGLRAQGKSMIFVSHNLGSVLQLADDIVVLRDGRVVDTGPRQDFTVDRMISRMVGRDIGQIFPTCARPHSGPPGRGPADEVVLEVRGLSQPGIIRDIDLVLHRAEVLGLFGLMGSGRTELARILFGLEPFERGQIFIHGVPRLRHCVRDSIAQGMAFVTENRREEGLLMEATVMDNMGLAALLAFATARFPRLLQQRRLGQAVARVAEALHIKAGPLHRTLAKHLSGGNQQKAVLGKWLMSRPAIFILDEPTRGIDVGAKQEVYRIIHELAGQGAGILLISSELEELMGMCDRLVVMSKGELRGRLERSEFDRERILHAAFAGHLAAQEMGQG